MQGKARPGQARLPAACPSKMQLQAELPCLVLVVPLLSQSHCPQLRCDRACLGLACLALPYLTLPSLALCCPALSKTRQCLLMSARVCCGSLHRLCLPSAPTCKSALLRGKAMQGKARQGQARQGKARPSQARPGQTPYSTPECGLCREKLCCPGKARQGQAREGKARLGCVADNAALAACLLVALQSKTTRELEPLLC